MNVAEKHSLKERALRFGFALFAVFVATYVRLLLTPVIQDRMPFSTYTVAVIVVAWLTGVWPTVIALIASTICAAHYVVPPEHSLAIGTPADLLGLSVFVVVGTISIAMFSRIETQRRSALEQATINNKLNEELIRRDRQKDEFLALLHHELRSPMAPMGNSISLLERQVQSNKGGTDIVKLLRKNFSHLVRLTNDLLDVSRFLRDAIALQCEPTNLGECIELALEMTRDDLKRKHHDLRVSLPTEPVIAHVDHVRTCQIICNLLSNAIKYTPDNGRISVRLGQCDSHVRIEVQDNGVGIPDSIRAKIFTPFFQANPKQSRYASGLGLGLSIVKKLVELHQGSIEVSSDGSLNGTQFIVTLPKSRSVAPESAETSKHKPMLLSHRGGPSDAFGDRMDRGRVEPAMACRILVVDDDPDTADTLSALLALEGFNVEIARTGIEAITLAESFLPHVVLLDIGLPELNGFEVARKLRTREAGANVRIIGLSGWGSDADKSKGHTAGFDDHLVKPIKLDELLSIINQPSLATYSSTRTKIIENAS